jgi:hypothetical protein
MNYGGKMRKINYFVLIFACFQFAAYSQTVPYAGDGPSVYVVRVISVDPAQRDAFVACLAKSALPFWRELKEKGLLAKVSVFETTSVTKSEPGVPAWNFVISSHLADGANADSFVQAVEKRKGCESAPGVEVRRTETLRTPPDLSTWARETAAYDLKARELKVEFKIEYIAVRDTPEAIDRWRDFMRLYEAPLVGLGIRAGYQFSAFALETAKVNYSQPGMPTWNDIHFVGAIPGTDWAAAKAALDPEIRQLNPRKDGFVADLGSIVTNVRNDSVRQLFELAVR